MKIQELALLPLMQTEEILNAISNKATHDYMCECLRRFYSGDFGSIPEEYKRQNAINLERGEGGALGRYPAAENLREDIYINGAFNVNYPGDISYNFVLVLFCTEYKP